MYWTFIMIFMVSFLLWGSTFHRAGGLAGDSVTVLSFGGLQSVIGETH